MANHIPDKWMKNKLLCLSFFSFLLVIHSCNTRNQNSLQALPVIADSLITNIGQFDNKYIATEGSVVHICGVDGRKMKLKTDIGRMIKIVPADSGGFFNKDLLQKRVRIYGIVKEFRLDTSTINKMENEKSVLCHVDHLPCKDTAWVNKNIKAGLADSMSIRAVNKLRATMSQTNKNYISVITIFANKCEIIGDPE
jgi:hypothetical protein